MGSLVVSLSLSLDGFVAPERRTGQPARRRGGVKLFEWWTAGTERVGPDDRFRPPARSRPVVQEMFEGGAIITGRRTFDIARGWGGLNLVAVLLGSGVRRFANLEGHPFDLDCTRGVESDGAPISATASSNRLGRRSTTWNRSQISRSTS